MAGCPTTSCSARYKPHPSSPLLISISSSSSARQIEPPNRPASRSRMLMTAALHLHMDSAVHGLGPSSSSPTSPRSPWLPAALADDNHRQHHQLIIPCDEFAASAPSPVRATAAPPTNHLRPVSARRVAKRRPRPSRKLPTTYITADPASFRRMVHQVTGADDLPPIISPPPAPETLCRPAPYRASTTGGAMLLPTLDTSAFLLGTGSAAGLPAAAPALVEAGGVGGPRPAAGDGGACNYNSGSSSCGGGGFPTLDSSWDDPLF